MFLETEERNNPSEYKGHEEAKSMSQYVYQLIRTIIYYQPPLIFTRLCYRWACWTIQIIINALLELLPKLTGDNTKNLKFTVEKLLGFLIGFFGPVIGYDYETVRQTAANKKGRALGMKPQDRLFNGDHEEPIQNLQNKAKFSCDLKIHKYEHAFDSLKSARRKFMNQDVGGEDTRRLSLSSDRLHHHHHHTGGHLHSHQLSDSNLSAPDKLRRSSMAPGTLESMIAQKTRHFSSGSSQSHRDYDDRESLHGSNLALGDDAQVFLGIQDPDDVESLYMEEDNSELLSMQVETYMDTK